MSNIYVQEPPTEGKVCFETTVGDIDIELWSKECPKACRNFVQLCLEGYYDKTKFFRVVPDFIVQGGDPTNSGGGGESVWGKPFKDEFHSRLRFVRRGLVAMANAGKDDNGSQFFFTLAATKELQNKHTIFGKVVGDTIYNMIRLGEGHIEDGDKPKYPHKIVKAKVLINPFPDVQPRMRIEQERDTEDRKKSKMKATKNFSLLSFGEEAEEHESDVIQATKSNKGKSKSAHDLAADPSLAADVDEELVSSKKSTESTNEGGEEEDALEKEINSIRNKLKKNKDKDKKISTKVEDNEEDAFDNWDENPFEKEREKKKEALRKEAKALSRELKGKDKKVKEDKKKEEEEEKETLTEEEKNNDMLREYHEEQKKYMNAKKDKVPKKKSAREEQTLALLNKFKSKLSGIVLDEEDGEKEKEKEKSGEGGEEDDDDIVGDDWMKTPLKFDNNDPVLAKDASTKDDDWFDIYDPRNKLNKRRREKDAVEGREKQRKEKMMKL